MLTYHMIMYLIENYEFFDCYLRKTAFSSKMQICRNGRSPEVKVIFLLTVFASLVIWRFIQ